jgi:asparagine N-glycosylation enzyme membrane subunit Stt3
MAGSALVVAAGIGIGIESFSLQTYFNNRYLDGRFLTGWQNFLREGSPWQALVPVVLAGLLALIGLARLESAPPEPAVGLRRLQDKPVPQMRTAMRRERHVVTTALTVLSALVALVWVRFLVYLALTVAGYGLARSSLFGVAIEALAWGLCWNCFWLWRRRYLAKLESWGITGGR